MKDDPEFNISFVSMVQQFPCLYDNTSLDYSNKNLQLKAWENIANQVNESVLDCKDRWKNLRGCFTRHLKNKSGVTGHRYRKPYYLAQHMNFLLPFTKPRLLASSDLCDSFQNEDEDTVVDDDGDDNNNYNNPEDGNGEDVADEYEEPNQSEETQDGDEGRCGLGKRVIKMEPFPDSNTKWQGRYAKRNRLETQTTDDSDLLFLKSLLPDMRAMDGSQKRRLKIGMETENQNHVWNKKFLESLLYSNSDRLVIKSNDKGKNPFIWSQFQIAYIDGVEQKYACCKLCKTFIKYTSRTGTGGLVRHLCFRKLNSFIHPKKRKPKQETSQDPDGMKFTTNTWVRLRLEGLVHKNSPRIGYVRNAKGKSHIWSQFRILTVDNILSKYACCMLCRSIVAYSGRTGTGSMTRHKCKVNKYGKMLSEPEGVERVTAEPGGMVIKEESFDWDEESSDRGTVNERSTTPPGIAEYNASVEEERVPGIPTEVERVLQEKHAAVVNKTLRLFDVFENEEFLELAQFLVNLGAQYGPMDVKNIFKRKMNLVTLNED